LIAANCNSGILVRGAGNAPGAQVQPSAATTSAGTEVGSYDALSGLVTASDGTVVRLGVTGGQSEYLGDKSWEALLYAGTGS
jgi:hypothetical protein